MLFDVIWNEIKYHFKNLTIYLFFIVLLLMFISQMGIPKASDLLKDTQKDTFYKVMDIEDDNKKIERMYMFLNNDYEKGFIKKNMFMFSYYKNINNEQKGYLKNAIDKIYSFDENNNMQINVTYDEYKKILINLDSKLKGHTIYKEPEEYGIYNEETSSEIGDKIYEEVMEKDKFTNAYARLFADYMGITAGFLPMFLSFFIFIREKRKKDYKNNYEHKISFTEYIFGKYLGLCLSIMICYFALAAYITLSYVKYSQDVNITIDSTAVYKYTFLWIGPTVLFTTALGIFMAVFFKKIIMPVLIHIVLWNFSVRPLSGNYSLNHFIIRFNTFGEYYSYIKWRPEIIQNRIFFTLISLVLVMISAKIYKKRELGLSH